MRQCILKIDQLALNLLCELQQMRFLICFNKGHFTLGEVYVIVRPDRDVKKTQLKSNQWDIN